MKLIRLLLKSFLVLLGLLLVIAAGFIAMNYKSDIPLDTLKEKYEFENSKYLEMDDMQIHYRITGQGEPLVLIHGYGGSLWNWEEWTNILQDSFQVISLDLPGFGFTGPRPDGDYSSGMYIDFLNRFFDQIGIDSFYMAGNSMGGGISWQYTLMYPERVEKLILVNSAGYPRGVGGSAPIGFKILGLPGVSKIITKVTPKSIMRKTVEGIYGDQSLVTEEGVMQFMDIMRRPGNRQALLDKRDADRGLDSDQIKSINVPTLIIWGDQDRLIHVDNTVKFEKDIEGSKAIIYKGVGHVPMMEIPERSAADLRAFLEE